MASKTQSFVISKNQINGNTGKIPKRLITTDFPFVLNVHIASQQESLGGTKTATINSKQLQSQDNVCW